MDDLLSTINSFEITPQNNTIHREHPRFSQYKAKSTGSSQEQRRKAVLEARKNKRYDLLTHLRQVEQQNHYDSDSDDMEVEFERKIYKRPQGYKDFLMLSEWLVDVPEDFSNTHYAMPCPVGKRNLVVTYNGYTKCYAKSGHFRSQFQSSLPGGSHANNRGNEVMLDCIYSSTTKTYYILDIVYWMNSSYMGCETQLRFDWLKSKFLEDCEEATKISSLNKYRFVPIPHTPCHKDSLKKMLINPMPFPEEVDGILFYHKLSHYTHGQTPLVGWLKPYMMKEILDVEVPESFLEKMPFQYKNINSFIVDYDNERKEIIKARRGKSKKAGNGSCEMQIDENSCNSIESELTSTN